MPTVLGAGEIVDESRLKSAPAGLIPIVRPSGRAVTAVSTTPTATSDGDSPITDFLSRLTERTEHGLGKLMPQGSARFIAENLIPQDPVDLGVWIASLALPEIKAGKMALKAGETVATRAMPWMKSTAMRSIMGTAAGGAIGGSVGERGQTATSGAIQGAEAGLLGAAFTKIGKMVTYFPWVSRVAADDPEKVGKVIQEMIPVFGKIRSTRDFQKLFSHGYGQRVLQDEYGKTIENISNSLGNEGVNSLTFLKSVRSGRAGAFSENTLQKRTGIPFEVVIDKVKSIRNDARKLEVRDPFNAQKLFAHANQIEEEAVASLPKDLAEQYAAAKLDYARGQSILRFFEDEDLLTNEGLNIEKLQKRFRSQGMSTPESVIAAGEVAQFEKALFRHADTGSLITDVNPLREGERPVHARVHMKGLTIPLSEIFTEKQLVGDLPSRPLELIQAMSPFAAGRVVGSSNRRQRQADRPNRLR